MTTIELGVLVLPEFAGRAADAVWRRVEGLGFAHGWTLDHLSWRSLRGQPWFDAMTTLTSAAAATTTLRLGTLVASPNFRHPVLTATQAMAIDNASDGRFILGIGAGAGGPDSTALGDPEPTPALRASRFEEFVVLVDRLLRQPSTTFTGRHYTASDVCMVPGCVARPRVPLAIAASGPRGMRLAAGFADIWVTIGSPAVADQPDERATFDLLRRQLDAIDAACEQVGRAPDTLRRLVNLSRVADAPYQTPGRFVDLVGRCGELGCTDVVVAYPRPTGVFAGDQDGFERAVLTSR